MSEPPTTDDAAALASRVEHLEFALDAIRGQVNELQGMIDLPTGMHPKSISYELGAIWHNATAWLEGR